MATAAEACLVFGEHGKALQWIARYVMEEEADAFELASTLRQLKEVWGLGIDAMPGSVLLPLLQSQLLQRRGGRVDLFEARGAARDEGGRHVPATHRKSWARKEW
jgi:hypothetical protein